jgi:hypothetical protein
MYVLILTIHSWLRWLAIAAGIRATVAAARDRGTGGGSAPAERAGLQFMILLDVQMLLGLALYFGLSPFTAEAFKDFGAAMKNPGLRFWAVEHVATMMAAVVLVHVGRVMARKAAAPGARRGRMLAFSGLSTLLLLIGTPWPGLPNGRPLFRF